jgi:hypothetical protein
MGERPAQLTLYELKGSIRAVGRYKAVYCEAAPEGCLVPNWRHLRISHVVLLEGPVRRKAQHGQTIIAAIASKRYVSTGCDRSIMTYRPNGSNRPNVWCLANYDICPSVDQQIHFNFNAWSGVLLGRTEALH